MRIDVGAVIPGKDVDEAEQHILSEDQLLAILTFDNSGVLVRYHDMKTRGSPLLRRCNPSSRTHQQIPPPPDSPHAYQSQPIEGSCHRRGSSRHLPGRTCGCTDPNRRVRPRMRRAGQGSLQDASQAITRASAWSRDKLREVDSRRAARASLRPSQVHGMA